MNDYINRQVEIRARAWGEAKALLDHAAAENRDLTAAETEQYDRINAELDERTAVIDSLMKDQEREVRAAELRVPATTETRVTEKSDTDILRELVAGERRSYTFEKRQMTTANNGGTVPQGFYAVMQEILRYTGPALDPASGYTVLNTASGEEIKVPVQSTFSTATATAEAAAFAVNNPTTTSFGLKAYKFGTLVTISRELLEDSGIDIEAFIARQAGNDLGRIINEKLAVGAGSTEPTGIVTASGSGITGGTAVGGAFSTENLIDLVHGVDSAYASRPAAAFQMRRATLSALRKLKDGEGRSSTTRRRAPRHSCWVTRSSRTPASSPSVLRRSPSCSVTCPRTTSVRSAASRWLVPTTPSSSTTWSRSVSRCGSTRTSGRRPR
jgi:HK97 family phage major capsid protein